MSRRLGPLLPVLLLFGLNFADTVLTLQYIGSAIELEGNPLMAMLLDVGPWAFIVYKIGLVAILCYILQRFWYYRRWIPWATYTLILVYVALMGYWAAVIRHME